MSNFENLKVGSLWIPKGSLIEDDNHRCYCIITKYEKCQVSYIMLNLGDLEAFCGLTDEDSVFLSDNILIEKNQDRLKESIFFTLKKRLDNKINSYNEVLQSIGYFTFKLN